MSRKPKVSTAIWHNLFCDDKVSVYGDANEYCFLKVVIPNSRPKYFYGETAHSDATRYCSDKFGISYWGVLD